MNKLHLYQQQNMNYLKPMKTAITIVSLVFFTSFLRAQQGRVHIEQDSRITELLKLYKTANSEAEFYTIQIGFGSFEKAEKLKSDAEIDFPGWYSKIVFDSPTYRVHIGRFSTKLEAEREFQEVRKKFPESLLLNNIIITNKKTRKHLMASGQDPGLFSQRN